MEKTRSNYVLFSFDEKKQSHQEYIERKRRLETILGNAEKEVQAAGLENQMVSARIELDHEKQLLVCLYKNHSFAAIMDNKSKDVYFNDNDNRLVNMRKSNFDKLELRLENAINYMIKTGTPNLVNQDVNRTWESAVPTLDKIIEFEKSLEQMPESKRNSFRQGKIYDQQIDEIIATSGTKELHPLEEQAWEDYYGIDVGHVGMRNIERPMSSLEEDIMEKNYHRDFGADGFVDEPWHQREHVEPVQSDSFAARLETAKQEALLSGKSVPSHPEPSIQNDEHELSREW